MNTLTNLKLKITKDEEIRNINTRRRNIMYLMHRYMLNSGLFNAADSLKAEAHLSDDLELCDNIDLDSIYLEYASYYQMKFGKFPKILRKLDQATTTTTTIPASTAQIKTRKKPKPQTVTMGPGKGGSAKEATRRQLEADKDCNDFQVTVTKIETGNESVSVSVSERETVDESEIFRQMQNVEHGSIEADSILAMPDWKHLSELVKFTIYREELKLTWADMCGNSNAVEILKEAVVAPIDYPDLFKNGLKPWRSMLVHGPPGSGKTLLAKVLYAETRGKTTFFNVTSSVVVSKWRGESEKIIKMLFLLARRYAPSVIFFDEIEGLTSRRDRPMDHESSKRFKNELLQLIDGMGHGSDSGGDSGSSDGVFILASTNLPWDIDEAFLRRFEKKVIVQLPDAFERTRLISNLLPAAVVIDETEMLALTDMSKGFTGDEIRLACKEIVMQIVRRSINANASTQNLSFRSAFEQVKPLSAKLMPKHEQWQNDHGS